MSPKENKAVVRRLFENVWNQGNIDVLKEIIAPDMIDHKNDGTQVVSDPRDQAEIFRERFAGFKNIQVSCDESIAEGDRVAIRWTASAVNGKTDKKLHKVHICIYHIEDGKIAEAWTCF